VLSAENVLARRYFYPGCHRMEPYRSDARTAATSLPVTERLAESVFTLPTGLQIDEDDIRRIGEILASAIENAAAVRSWIGRRMAA
jgi:dTDP-4-amino-4,6-dideoxygalactose transaminase